MHYYLDPMFLKVTVVGKAFIRRTINKKHGNVRFKQIFFTDS